MIGLNNLQDARDYLSRVRTGASEAFGLGKEDFREALKRGYAAEGRETDASRIDQMMGSNRTITMARELMGMANPAQVQARNEMGIGLSPDPATRDGQVLGTLASDVVQDRGRSIWWLLNAPQAAANVAQEAVLGKVAPNLYEAPIQKDDRGAPITTERAAKIAGLLGPTNKPLAGITTSYEDIGERRNGKPQKTKVYRKRRYAPGMVEALSIPAGLTVNAGVGLLNPFGGAEGYKAVIPSDEDPSKTDNAVMEVAAKYLLGRTGGLLPWDEFKKVRPDVSKDEYMRYKAFKFDNKGDANPFDDGQVVLPTGVIKATTEGIHGPEIQFLGKSLPIATTVMPTAAAILGTAYGARGRYGGPGRGLAAGLGSALGAMGIGNAIEEERRRRNALENQIDTIN
jgi:hypothetical protein